MQKSFTFLVVPFCLVLLSCSSVTPGSNDSVDFKFTPDGEDSSDGGGDSFRDKSVPDPKPGPAFEPLGEPPGDNESDLLPVGSLPGPALVPAGALNKTLIASADKEGHVPAVGYPGAVDTKDENYDPDAKYQVIMTPKNEAFANAPQPPLKLRGGDGGSYANFPRPLWERIFYSPLPRGEGIKGRVADVILSAVENLRITLFSHFRTAIAESPPPNTCSETLADSLDMNLDDAACCDVKKDGSFTCYYKDKEAEAVDYAKLESQEYCLYLTDGKEVTPFHLPSPPVGEGQGEGCESPNKHALWLSQTSFDVSPFKSLSVDNGYTGFRVLAGPQRQRVSTSALPDVDQGTNIIGLHSIIPSPEISPPSMGGDQGEGERLRVTGNYANNYGEMSVNASELAFSFFSSPSWGEGQGEGGTHTFAMRRIVESVFGVKEVCQQEGEFNFICDPLDFAKGDEQLEKYLKLKTTRDGQIWFSGKYKEPTKTPNVKNLKEIIDPDSKIYISYYDKDAEGKDIVVSEILNFDVDENGYALAVFRDDKGQLKIRVGNEDAFKRYGYLTLENISVADLKFYYVKTEIAKNDKGKEDFFQNHSTILLDQTGNKLYQISDSQKNKNISLKGSITVGNNPTEMALNSGSNRVFVINSGDATITVLPLLNETAEVLTVEQMEAQKKTFNLKDLFSGKSIPFKPEQIVYDDLGTTDKKDDRLIIGDKGIKSAIAVPISVVIPAKAGI